MIIMLIAVLEEAPIIAVWAIKTIIIIIIIRSMFVTILPNGIQTNSKRTSRKKR